MATLDAFHTLVVDPHVRRYLMDGQTFLRDWYALFARYCGRGDATEMARASIAHARTCAGFGDIAASVDEINAASLHILEKLGFERCGSRPGAFGATLLLRLAAPAAA